MAVYYVEEDLNQGGDCEGVFQLFWLSLMSTWFDRLDVGLMSV